MSCAPDSTTANSPMATRFSSERRPLAPVTPQRINRANKQNRASHSPLTPSNSSLVSSPFTPITNLYNTSSSPLTTPGSSTSSNTRFDNSPESVKSKYKSLADATNNWRTRAKENGIKVTADNCAQLKASTPAKVSDKLPACFSSSQRRSKQALFQTKSTDCTAFISPKAARIPVGETVTSLPIYSNLNLSSSLLSTPEPPRNFSGPFNLSTPSPQTSLAIIQKLRQRGSLTDPAQPRRRDTFGSTSGNALFEIDENDTNIRAGYPAYPPGLDSPLPSTFGRGSILTTKGLRAVSAPFIRSNMRIANDFEEDDDSVYDEDGLPHGDLRQNQISLSVLRATKSTSNLPEPVVDTQDVSDVTNARICSVCSASSSPLSSLIPCGHLICSSCLTGSLNIVGEKEMRCSSCNKPVENFKLLTPLKIANKVLAAEDASPETEVVEDQTIRLSSVLDQKPADSSTNEQENDKQNVTSQTNTAVNSPAASAHSDANVLSVLRIDNVPWDITPPALTNFFAPYVVVRAHVLLDPKGKTLSHAYVEVNSVDARAALRAVQNKTMGKGRRMRGVTVTMSAQSELMRAIFPGWKGEFEDVHPTLVGLDNVGVVHALENGIIAAHELEGLMALMRNPKSHFLKVPSLPFHSLVSILSKFPTDQDSRVFWNLRLRDLLYDVAFGAIQILISRVGSEFHNQDLLDSVIVHAFQFEAFTEEQRIRVYELADARGLLQGDQLSQLPRLSPRQAYDGTVSSASEILTPDDSASLMSGSSARGSESVRAAHIQNLAAAGFLFSQAVIAKQSQLPIMRQQFVPFQQRQNAYDILAHEFGVEPDLVAALAQRLAMTGPGPASAGLFQTQL